MALFSDSLSQPVPGAHIFYNDICIPIKPANHDTIGEEGHCLHFRKVPLFAPR